MQYFTLSKPETVAIFFHFGALPLIFVKNNYFKIVVVTMEQSAICITLVSVLLHVVHVIIHFAVWQPPYEYYICFYRCCCLHAYFVSLHASLLCSAVFPQTYSILNVCVPVSLQLSPMLCGGSPQVPGVPRGVVAHSSGSRNHDAFCMEREAGRVMGRKQ